MGALFSLSSALSFLLYCSWSIPRHRLLCSAATDVLSPGQTISGNQTLVSARQTFALGFFRPANSTTAGLYAGIWYNQIPVRTVVWVANRDNPLRDSDGVLTVTREGNIALLDQAGRTVWSTGLSRVSSNTSVVLQDTGNLVLTHGGSVVWQCFDHPTDTLLPNMELRSNLTSGAGTKLTAWRDAADPSPGQFSFAVDPKNSLQPCTFRGSEIYWRGTVWDGKPTITNQVSNLNALYVQSVVKSDDDIYWTFYMVEASFGRFVLNYTGMYTFFYWLEKSKTWLAVGSFPTRLCDFYNRCGPFGACEYILGNCTCLDGFEPRNREDWQRGNFTAGCVRRRQLLCDGTDGFKKLPGIKLPDGFYIVWNKRTMAQCEEECAARCLCQAYAYANVTTLKETGSRCLLWQEDMKDLGRVPAFSEDLYLRLPASELAIDTQTGGSSDNDRNLILILFTILAAGLPILGAAGYIIMRRTKEQKKRERSETVLFAHLSVSGTMVNKDITELPLIDFNTIASATDSFSASNKLGEGGFGPVYKGVIPTGMEVAVKRLSRGSSQGQEEFRNEVALIAKLQHRNLVRLVGSCIQGEERILIYEYVPNGSLNNFLFDPAKQAQLDWETRFNIIKGIARGLMYLHQDSRFKIVHRDLKASNVLLDENMNPKISDFGMARMFGGVESRCLTQRVVGTYGYMSPEYAMEGHYSVKSDVYSFGVLLLEIVSGRRNNIFFYENVCLNLLTYAWHMWKEDNVMGFSDRSIASTSSPAEVSRCLHVGLMCVQDHASKRPLMTSVVFMLENDVPFQDNPKRPMFMLEAAQKDGEGTRSGSSAWLSVNDVSITAVEGR